MRDHKYFAYIVCSRSGTLYIGMTNSIYRRALEHKRGEVEGFASKYHCDRMVYYESWVPHSFALFANEWALRTAPVIKVLYRTAFHFQRPLLIVHPHRPCFTVKIR